MITVTNITKQEIYVCLYVVGLVGLVVVVVIVFVSFRLTEKITIVVCYFARIPIVSNFVKVYGFSCHQWVIFVLFLPQKIGFVFFYSKHSSLVPHAFTHTRTRFIFRTETSLHAHLRTQILYNANLFTENPDATPRCAWCGQNGATATGIRAGWSDPHLNTVVYRACFDGKEKCEITFWGSRKLSRLLTSNPDPLRRNRPDTVSPTGKPDGHEWWWCRSTSPPRRYPFLHRRLWNAANRSQQQR